MEHLSLWVKSIIIAVVVCGIIEMILPKGNNKKYIKVVIGIYIVFVIVNPVLSMFSDKSISIDNIIDKYEKKINTYNVNRITFDTNEYISKTCKEKIKEDIKSFVNEKGYSVDLIDVDIVLSKDEKYAEISNILIRINKKEAKLEKENKEELNKSKISNKIDNIEKININVSENSNLDRKNEYNNKLSKDEINSIKKDIKEKYNLNIDKIHINE